MSVHEKNLVDPISQHRFHDIIDHMDHRLIIKGQRKWKRVIMSAVSDCDRRQYQHSRNTVCDLFTELIGNDRITSLCQMLAMSFTGTDCEDRLIEFSFFYLMCCHFLIIRS